MIAVLSILGFLSIPLLAFLTRTLLQPSSILYCVPQNSPFTISTLNTSTPHPQCFRVHNGIFTEILDGFPPLEYAVTFLDGYVLPGLIESHGHILQYGEMLESVALYGAESIEEVKTRIKEFLATHEGEGYGTREKWIRGIGWDQAYFGGIYPTARELSDDPVLKGLYVMADRVDVHCVYVSEAVLDLLPNPLPEAPPGGVIVTDPGPGVFCDNAMDEVIYPLAPKPDIEQKTRWLKSAMKELNKVGIIGVGDAGMRADDIKILEGMAKNGESTIRINVMLECEERNAYCPNEIQGLELFETSDGIGDEMLLNGGVKLFADGALGSWGAALLEPYSDKPEISGTMLINETELTKVVHEWFEAGFQINIHAIGDRANRAAVDAFESVLGSDCNGCNHERRFRIEHAQIIHPADQKRIAKMGIIPSIQPTHATSDMSYALDRLGEDRLTHSAYRMSSLFSQAIPTVPGPVLGSDFPVEPPSPFHGIYAAVTRLSPTTGTSPSGPQGWYPSERLSLLQALRGFTLNPAYAWFQESRAGDIEVGKWADWTMVDGDVFELQTLAEEGRGAGLRELKVLGTWVGGRKVWSVDGTGEDEGVSGGIWEKVMDWVERFLWDEPEVEERKDL